MAIMLNLKPKKNIPVSWRKRVKYHVHMHVLPLSRETRQAVTGAVSFRAVPSIKAAVVPSCTHACRLRQLRKSEQTKNTKKMYITPTPVWQ